MNNKLINVYSLTIKQRVDFTKSLINNFNNSFYQLMNFSVINKEDSNLFRKMMYLESSLFILNVNNEDSLNDFTVLLDQVVDLVDKTKVNNIFKRDLMSSIELFNVSGGNIIDRNKRQAL